LVSKLPRTYGPSYKYSSKTRDSPLCKRGTWRSGPNHTADTTDPPSLPTSWLRTQPYRRAQLPVFPST
ncbi:hypothetical protein AB1N83_009215, partial [Pleurotus pulmonarius]